MRFRVIAVGKLKDRALDARVREYLKWLTPYAATELLELPDSNRERESAAVLKQLEKERGSYRIVLGEEGREFDSDDFARHLRSIDRGVVFVVGGPAGLTPEVKAAADLVWSLSRLTFTHELARLLLAEQLFRAVNILHGGQYHIRGQ